MDLQVLFGDNDARPHMAEEFVFGDQRSVGLQQDQEEIECARPQLYRHAVGDQLPLAQQHLETAEFECYAGCCRARADCVMRWRVFAVDGGLGTATRPHRGGLRSVMACNLARPCSMVALMVVKLCKPLLQLFAEADFIGSNAWAGCRDSRL